MSNELRTIFDKFYLPTKKKTIKKEVAKDNVTGLMKKHNYAIKILRNFELIARNNCAKWKKYAKETTMAKGKFKLYRIQQTQLESAIKRLEEE